MPAKKRNPRSIKTRFLSKVSVLLALCLLFNPVDAETNEIDADAFNARVLSIASAEFPALGLKKTENPLLFSCEGGKLSLDNLYKVVKHEAQRGKEDEEIRRFLKSITEIKGSSASVAVPWESVKDRLRPQIFPANYLKQTKKRIVSRPLPFTKNLMEGFVVDSENTFQYVTREHLESWGVDLEIVRKWSYDNLDKASHDLKFEVTEAGGKDAKGKYITISITDGYAAARILLPEIRKRLQKDLGDPCFVAIPNRDFLIGWSPDFTHKERFVEQVRKDFESRHHPLTPQVYELDASNLTLISSSALEASDSQPRSRRHRRRH